MMKMMGAINTRGFTSCVSEGVLPPDSHITYEGVFNQLKFDVGPKTQKTVDCHFGYARYQFTKSLFDKEMNDYLCLFLKSERNGADRNEKSLNAVVCLDISGSMGGGLSRYSKNSRLQLSIQAIKMFISKLRPNDSIGMVIFNNKAEVVFEQIYKKDLDEKFFVKLDAIKSCGGTTIQSGLQCSKDILKKFTSNNKSQNAENRIIMLTDVCDNSISGTLKFVDEASKNDDIHLTIIGLSNEFQSSTCESLKNVKGFNYFCAINDEDIKKHVFQEFNYNFLSVAHNVQILIQSDNVESFETFGAPDSENVNQYNQSFKEKSNQFVVSRTATIFPSQIQIVGDKTFTHGGVILIKLRKKQKSSQFKGTVKIKYVNQKGQNQIESFQIQFNFPQNQQFYSEESLRQALEGYAFTSEMKKLLRKMKQENKKDRNLYLQHLGYLETIAPKDKKNDIDSIRKILSQKEHMK